jgi:predicted DNA binding CopG/RHH family protein
MQPPKKQKKLQLPNFSSEREEQQFWDRFDLSEYATVDDLEDVELPNLRPTTKPISLRIPEFTIARLKAKANAIDIPYQALIKKYIADGIQRDDALSAHERPRRTYTAKKQRKR